jgi:hypothetical protein
MGSLLWDLIALCWIRLWMKDSVGQDKKEQKQKQRSRRDETKEPVVLYQTGSCSSL